MIHDCSQRRLMIVIALSSLHISRTTPHPSIFVASYGGAYLQLQIAINKCGKTPDSSPDQSPAIWRDSLDTQCSLDFWCSPDFWRTERLGQIAAETLTEIAMVHQCPPWCSTLGRHKDQHKHPGSPHPSRRSP